jgi:glucose 1-dehydrogenase
MSKSKFLKNQIALVTGASSGIGEGIAKAMGAAGAKVVVNFSSSEDAANRVVQDIKDSGSESIAVRTDVSNEDQVVSMFKKIFDEYGTIDILVNNSGVQKDSEFVNMTREQWERVLDVNLTGAFLCSREAAREFIRRGIVIPWAGHVNYAASKGGIMLFMKSIAQELAPHRIRVNSIGPGAIKTNINRATWETPEAKADLLQLIPYRKIGEPADIARVAVWLASDEADYITGTTIYADGGMLLYPGFSAGG